MYELTDKKIKDKFKKTEYGQKINKSFLIALTILISVFVIFTLLYFLNYKGVIELDDVFIELGKYILFIVAIFACYMDGKRDGAIIAFKNKTK